MTRTDSELLKAILAIYSYNREYKAGVILDATQTKVGSAQFRNRKESRVDDAVYESWQAVGFYAAAYRLDDGSSVIAYRGTDRMLGDGDTLLQQIESGDIWNRWTLGAGTHQPGSSEMS